MTLPRSPFRWICLLLGAGAGHAEENAASSPARDEAIRRAIPYVEEKGVDWMEEHNCVSCHRVNTMVWGLSLARKKGFKVSDELDDWIDWSVNSLLAKNDKGKVVGLGNKEGVAQLLVGLKDDLPETTRERLAALLPEAQRPDGSWKPGGQLPSQKRPPTETTAVSALWISLATDDETARRANRYVEKHTSAKSVEARALRLLRATKEGDDKERKRITRSLLDLQRTDGGWGWLSGDPSDALGTGLALYALRKAGLPRDEEALKRAAKFLTSTQRTDGSWPVRGTKAKKKGAVQETASYWGATWALIALATDSDEPANY